MFQLRSLDPAPSVKRATIADFLFLEEEQGTMVASRALGEELVLLSRTYFEGV